MVNLAHRASLLGTETAFTVLARAAELTRQGRDIINLGIGQPDFPTPEHIVEAGIKALRDGHHGYTPSGGILPLKEAVASNIHQRLGTEVSPANIQIPASSARTASMRISPIFASSESTVRR